MATVWTYIQAFFYIALLFFFIPIKIDGPDESELRFQEYLKKFNKSYEDVETYQTRLQAFKQSLQTINFLNSNKTNSSAVYGLTKFSDLLPKEFLENHLQANLSQTLFLQLLTAQPDHKSHNKRAKVPQKIDWREKNSVTGVNNQGSCGACWAYAVVETVESMHAIENKVLERFSVQQIIDCAGNNNNGCEGGDICTLLDWMRNTNFTLLQTKDYHGKGHCRSKNKGVVLEQFMCENFIGLEDIMLRLLAENGPLAVAINAQTWQNYIGGVIEYHCDGNFESLNHAVQIVGYDLTADVPFYIVRNSWGTDFGDNGYLYVAIGQNMCGLANEVAALTVL